MRQGYTHIVILVDKSGSMGIIRQAVVDGFNGFISEQKAAPGEATVTLEQFNTLSENVLDFVGLDKISSMTYNDFVPNGGTALNDSLGNLINKTGDKLAALKEEERPNGVLFLVITDGDDNASSAFSSAQIKEMVTHQETKYGWKFIYIGANVDVKLETKERGFSDSISFESTTLGVKNMSRKMSASSVSYRASR